MKTVAIVDFNSGNLFSVERACQYVGLNPVITSDPKILMKADGMILPGVGAFGEAISNLRRLDLEFPIRDYVGSGRPFMGVCLGLQLLFSESVEFGNHKGLGLLDGTVAKFPRETASGEKLRVPHIGWSTIEPAQDWKNTPLEDVSPGRHMYFVHSYYVVPSKKENVLSKTVYEGIDFCSSVRSGNIFAFQFHPEKSSEDGLKVYKSWARFLTK